MKKTLLVAILMLFILSLVACGAGNNETSIVDGETSVIENSDKTDIKFEHVDRDAAPTEVQEKVDQAIHDSSAGIIVLEKDIYILITMGEQPTGGYEVKIHQVLEVEEEVRVLYELISPGEGDMTTQVITYPYALIKIPNTDKSIVFEKVEQVKID